MLMAGGYRPALCCALSHPTVFRLALVQVAHNVMPPAQPAQQEPDATYLNVRGITSNLACNLLTLSFCQNPAIKRLRADGTEAGSRGGNTNADGSLKKTKGPGKSKTDLNQQKAASQAKLQAVVVSYCTQQQRLTTSVLSIGALSLLRTIRKLKIKIALFL